MLAPAGAFDSYWIGKEGLVKLELTRDLAGVTEKSTVSINVTAMPASIYKPGTVALVVARIAQSIMTQASSSLLQSTSASIYRANIAQTFGSGSPPAMTDMNIDQLKVLDRLLLSWLLALGLDITASPKFKSQASLRHMAPPDIFGGASSTDISLFDDLAAMTNALASKARESAGKLITAGGVAVAVGLTVAAGTALGGGLIVGGAAAIGAGLMFGMAEGFVFDNAINFAGNGTAKQIEWGKTAKFYGEQLLSNFTENVLAKNFGSKELLTGPGSRLYAFAVDTTKSFISAEIASKIAVATSRILGVVVDVKPLPPYKATCRSPEVVGPNVDLSLPLCPR
ncbi:hypothetical protein F2P44_19205 [Massilia sp. CCM 8695]|uniref:Uncharacterized protein n=1 Tax=Massilia frigida TaxID=2609281 RepID=A0ABX0NAQ1_9BURK|nr:hypothetical protein [Massilia frigida]NHZ81388.1 hypothetical protein [Massilia frigida]